ncbi:pyridoxal phosphate-dependent aminotransferase [Desulfovibrio ferrophilus]|uniref:Aminotransferase n=1 Tax=Desulfovibrio ferrophilus TaxID=241368 RepID=A0A2Z6B2C6_9BACT|nr:pyridoxal phosphate-dependent aminotransferase [Desulfovibrio ferrophilus]BBD09598.1 class I and II aminotransferase [Desulfovibrio ferrophilus]
MPSISRRVQAIKISDTKLMPMIAAKVGGCVSLGQGVPSFATPEHVVDAVCSALRQDSAAGKYTLQPGLPALREAVAELLGSEKGVQADPETEIVITVGAMEALLAAILTLVERGDEVLIPSPYYASHVEQILLAEGVPVPVPLRSEDWGLDLEAMERAVTSRTKAVLLCNPSNPTGAVYPDADLKALAALCERHGLFVITDETYDSLTFDSPMPMSLASLPELAGRVILVNSFSKRFALTGWRVGYAYAAKPLMDEMLKVHDCTAICAPAPSQAAALAALTGPQDIFVQMGASLKARRELACARLDELRDHFSYVRPGGAFYIMARYLFSSESSREMAQRMIREARVVTIPGGAFGPEGDGHLRLSYGASEKEINEAFDRIQSWVLL